MPETAPAEVVQIVVSGTGACLRWSTGRVRCFGTSDPAEPVNDAVDLSSDGETTCIARENGTVACWGFQAHLNRDQPSSNGLVPLAGLKDITDVELQYASNSLSHPMLCATTRAGDVICSCRRTKTCPPGKLDVVNGAPRSRRAVGTREAGCALTRDGRVWCWNTWRSAEGRFVAGLSDVEELLGYDGATCVRQKNDRVSCWGSNDAGQLGRGYKTFVGDPSERPTDHSQPMAVGPEASFMAAGAIVDDGGKVFVWGDNDYGQRLPTGEYEIHEPTEYAALGAVRLVAGSSKRSCSLDDAGVVKCWGAPAPLAPADAREVEQARGAVAIEAAHGHICALLESGRVTCWGNRQAEDDDEDDLILEPRDMGVSDAVEIAVSFGSICARSKDRQVRCWGESEFADGEPLPGRADAIGFVRDTLCLSDQAAMRCTHLLAVGPDQALTPKLIRRVLRAPPAAPRKKLLRAGPGGSHGWAQVVHKPCFIRQGKAFCVDGKRFRAMPNVTGVKELGEETILLNDGTVVSARKPKIRASNVPIRALVGRRNLGAGEDGRLYHWSFGGSGKTWPRKKLAAITDAVDMVGDGFPSSFGCVLRKSGKVFCWGSGARGEIGLGDRRHPREVGRIE